MKSLLRHATPVASFPLLASVLQAHPGHASNSFHSLLANPFSGVDHLIAWSLVLTGTALVVFLARRGKRGATGSISEPSTISGRR